jgi:hypothetical protein
VKLCIAPRPTVAGPVDSTAYIFAFTIHSPNDLPADFDLPGNLHEFTYGVFLPRAEADWFGRIAYPPRVVLLSQTSLVIAAHPASGELSQIIPLRQLQFVEYGHCLLLGWISFASSNGVRELRFNTRTSRPVEGLLDQLSKQYAPCVNSRLADRADCLSFGEPLDIKFRNAEASALYSDERILTRLFHPVREIRHRSWGLFPVESHEPSDYLAVTNRRFLWITDRNRGAYERYGSILKSAPLDSVIHVSSDHSVGSYSVVCQFKDAASWCIPLPTDRSDGGAAFVERARSLLLSRADRKHVANQAGGRP